jgi:hypothetical protein
MHSNSILSVLDINVDKSRLAETMAQMGVRMAIEHGIVEADLRQLRLAVPDLRKAEAFCGLLSKCELSDDSTSVDPSIILAHYADFAQADRLNAELLEFTQTTSMCHIHPKITMLLRFFVGLALASLSEHNTHSAKATLELAVAIQNMLLRDHNIANAHQIQPLPEAVQKIDQVIAQTARVILNRRDATTTMCEFFWKPFITLCRLLRAEAAFVTLQLDLSTFPSTQQNAAENFSRRFAVYVYPLCLARGASIRDLLRSLQRFFSKTHAKLTYFNTEGQTSDGNLPMSVIAFNISERGNQGDAITDIAALAWP